METLIVMAVVLNSLILLGIIVGLAVVLVKISSTAKIAEEALSELPETLRAAQGALKGLESLGSRAEDELGRVDQVLKSVDRLISGAAVANAAISAVRGSKLTAVSVLSGVREAIKVFRARKGETKEDTGNV